MPGLGGGDILWLQSYRHSLGCPSGLALGSSGKQSMPCGRAEMAYHNQQNYWTGLSPDCHPGTLRHVFPLYLCALSVGSVYIIYMYVYVYDNICCALFKYHESFFKGFCISVQFFLFLITNILGKALHLQIQ